MSGPTHKLYEFFGVELPAQPNGSKQLVTDCPFCDRKGHFYISEETSLFQCKDANCAVEGNPYTFMELLYKKALSGTKPNSHRRLSKARKNLPLEAFVQARVVWYDSLNNWLIPYRNTKGTLVGLSKYKGEGPPFAAPGCSTHLWGLDQLKPTGPIFICEGQWDAIALRWLLRRCRNAPEAYTVLGAPGATSLPKADLEHLARRDVYLLYDHDDAGRNGTKVACGKLAPIADKLYLHSWPERTLDGYDIEDLVRESTVRPDDLFQEIMDRSFLFQKGADPTVVAPELSRSTVGEIYKDFEDTHIYLYPGLKDFLTLTMAVITSTRLQGEPLWLYGIGDPGAGKSLVLESTLGSRQCIYRTSVTHKAFMSGFKNEGEDRSLLSLLPGRSLIVKDYSNVLSLPHMEQDQLVSLLREAFDGRIIRSYGNNVYREYPPPDSIHKDCRFSFVAGVTKEIHARSHAGLGERFLKYEIPRSSGDNLRAMMAAITDTWMTHEHKVFRTAAVGAFLDRNSIDYSKLPDLPRWFIDRTVALAQFIGLARSPVSRTNGDLDYSPSPEAGTRSAKQLVKLAQSLCFVLGLAVADQEVYRLVRKVSWDTAHGWRRDLMLFLFQESEMVKTQTISDATGFSLATTHRQLHDMHALKVASRRREGKTFKWALTPWSRKLVEESQMEEV